MIFIKNKLLKSSLIVLLFLCLSGLYIYPLMRTNIIFSAGDLPYHINRIQEIIDNLRSGEWYPYLYTFHFRNTAYMLGVFYPQLTLLPYAVAGLLLKNDVDGIYIGMAFYTFLSMINMYIITRKLKRSTVQSLLTAISYGFCTYRFINAFSRFALGEYIGMTFIPLALYGLYAVMKGERRDWPYLALGLSFTLFSHIISTFLCLCLLVIIFAVCFKGIFDKERLNSLLLSIVFFFLCSAIFIVPFLEQLTFKRYNQPSPTFMPHFAQNLSTLILNSNSNLTSAFQVSNWWELANIGFILLVALIWGIFNYRKLDEIDKFLIITGSLLFLMSTSIFPWTLGMRTPLRIIQFPFRLLELDSILLSPIFGTMIVKTSKNLKLSNSKLIILGILFVIMPWYSGVKNLILLQKNQSNNFFNSKVYSSKSKNMTYWWLDQYTPKMTKKSFNSVVYHYAYVNNKKVVLQKLNPISNGIIIKDKKVQNQKQIILPIAHYKNLEVYQGKSKIPIKEKDNLIMLAKTNNKPLKIKYEASALDSISKYVSILFCLILLSYIIKIEINNMKLT